MVANATCSLIPKPNGEPGLNCSQAVVEVKMKKMKKRINQINDNDVDCRRSGSDEHDDVL